MATDNVIEAPADTRSAIAERFNLAPDGTKFKSRFIEPGLVSYRDTPGGGLELLRKETIDRCLATAIGNPLTIGHVYVNPENRLDVENGVVTGVSYNVEDGWYYCEGTVDTDQARSAIRGGQAPSCAYAVMSFGPGGTYHGIKFDREITDIVFQHLAIVEKPRYEGAIFRLNSITNQGKIMFKFLKKLVTRKNDADGKVTEAVETHASEVSGETTVEIDGQTVRLNDLASVWKTQKGQVFNAGAEDEFEIDGTAVRFHELVSAYRKHRCHEAEAAKALKETPAQEKQEPPMQEKQETPAEEKREHEAQATATAGMVESKQNAAPAAPAVAPATAPIEAAPAKSQEHFNQLHFARENSVIEIPKGEVNSGSITDRVKAGQARYGSASAK
jgi:hypothetical protein